MKTNVQEVAETLGSSLKPLTQETSWDLRIKFTNKAPVIGLKDQKPVIGDLVFPASPFPNSRLSQIESNKKMTTASVSGDEEAIVRVYEVPLWKEGFSKLPCIVPMTSFFEPCYWGEKAGEIVRFEDPDHRVLFVPGFVVKPRVPSTDKPNGFTMLTHVASEQMLRFHHRLLVFLKPQRAIEYLFLDKTDPQQRFEFLLQHRLVPDLEVSTERKMAKGWERRVSQHLDSLKAEQGYRQTLDKEQVLA